MRIVSAAFGPLVTLPMNGLSDSDCSANTMSRWRESSGRSFGSQIVPPGESSSGNACDSRTRFSKSFIVASRRTSPSRANGQPHEVLEVVHRRLAAHVTLARERAAVDRGEDHVVAADVGCVLGVARLPLELARRLRHLLEHELGIEEHAVAVDHLLTGLAELLDGLVEQELDADLRDDPAPAAVQHGHGVLAEDLVARHGVDEHALLPVA